MERVGCRGEGERSSGDVEMPLLTLAAVVAIGTPAYVKFCQWVGQL